VQESWSLIILSSLAVAVVEVPHLETLMVVVAVVQVVY
jgi:hypothetical protein